MVQCLGVRLIIAFCVIGLSAGMCFAEAEREAAHPIAELDASAHYERNWYLAMGTANYHPRLRDSEAQIDRRLNAPLGWLPFWKEPATSKDRRDRFMLWGLSLGIGRDMTPRTSLMLWINGATGAVKNKERYGPVRTDIRFSRTSASLSLEGFFYPWDKVDYGRQADTHGTERVRVALTNAKPYISLATGYSFIRSEGSAKFKLPVVGTVLQQTEKYDHHMMQVSPRIGVELPLSQRTSLTAAAVYYFFWGHSREYNGPSLSVAFRRRF